MSKDFTQLKSCFWDSGFRDGHRIAEAGASGCSLHGAMVQGRVPLCPAHPPHPMLRSRIQVHITYVSLRKAALLKIGRHKFPFFKVIYAFIRNSQVAQW